ncbi:MAG: hypothetical protein V1723_01325, partial [Candidatus Uhrbacteria bacterium]
RTYQDLHDILHYIRRDDPRGPPPDHPENDLMYEPWEAGVRAWAAREGIALGLPPDDNGTSRPNAEASTLTISSPNIGAIIDGREILIEGTTNSSRNIQRIDVRVDGTAAGLLGLDGGRFRGSIRLPPTTGRGPHNLTVIASDETGSVQTATVPIEVRSNREAIALTWEQPTDGAVFRSGDFPITLVLRASTTTGATRLELSIRDNTGEDRLLTNVVPPSSGPIRVLWPTAPPGTVTLHAELFAGDERIAAVDPITIRVE